MTRTVTAHEAAAAARLVGQGAAELTARIGETHDAIADRAFRLSGPLAVPAHLLHDAIASGVYAAVATSSRVGGVAAGEVMRRRVSDRAVVRAGRRTGQLLAAVNGAFGDTVAVRHPELDLGMHVRADGHDVPLTGAGLAAAFPAATGTVAVLLHGLCEDDTAWCFGTDGPAPYVASLDTAGVTPVLLRYNSGRHISTNGAALADLLVALVAGWPVEVDRLALVGHSLGGLVARSAGAVGLGRGDAWVPLVRSVVYLATPHSGAPLERVVARGVRLLERLPETRPLARGLRARSVGVKDLRHGALLDGDWAGLDPDGLSAGGPADVPLLPEATHHVVSASLSRDHEHPVGRLLGDLLVLHPGAHGRHTGGRQPFVLTTAEHIGGRHHFQLLSDARVAAALPGWVRGDRRGEVRGDR